MFKTVNVWCAYSWAWRGKSLSASIVFNSETYRIPSYWSKAWANCWYQALFDRYNPDCSMTIHQKGKHMASSPLFPKWGSITAGTKAAEAQRRRFARGQSGPTPTGTLIQEVLFRPQEVNKAFDSSARDLEPLLRNKGHGDQLSLGRGGSEGKVRTRSGLILIKYDSVELC